MLISAYSTVKTLKIATTLEATDRVVLLDVSSDFTVTLPVVTEAAGLIVSFRVLNREGSYAATIATPGAEKIAIHGGVAADTVVLDALGEYSLLYCNGAKWYELSGNHA